MTDSPNPTSTLSIHLKKHPPATRIFDPAPTFTSTKSPLIPQPTHKRPLYVIPIAICLAILLALLIALIVLARKGKFKRLFSFGGNPYSRQAKRQAQIERVAKVEAERVRDVEKVYPQSKGEA